MDENNLNHSGTRNRPDLGATFGQTLGNMRFVGLATMIYGILTCLTIVGAIIGIPTIIAANRLLGAVKILEEYRLTGVENHLASGFHELGRAFGIVKVLIIISLVLLALEVVGFIIFGGVAMLAGLAQG